MSDLMWVGYRSVPTTVEDVRAQVGPGWGTIIEALISNLLDAGWDGKLSQVKEKFGGLRFYLGGETNDDIETLIEQAEKHASRTCEVCGAAGKARGGGWLKTLCDEHSSDE